MEREIRVAAQYGPEQVEFRAAEEDKPPTIRGYAAIFNAIADLGYFREKIMPGAFKRALKEKQDVRALVDHDPAMIIGRSKAGTLKLREDDKGLHVEIIPPETTVGRDVVESLKRGDLDQMSFGFIPVKWRWIEPTERGQMPTREIEDVDLFDVSIVAYPAYEQTSVSVRSETKAEVEEIMKRQDATAAELVEVYERASRHLGR